MIKSHEEAERGTMLHTLIFAASVSLRAVLRMRSVDQARFSPVVVHISGEFCPRQAACVANNKGPGLRWHTKQV